MKNLHVGIVRAAACFVAILLIIAGGCVPKQTSGTILQADLDSLPDASASVFVVKGFGQISTLPGGGKVLLVEDKATITAKNCVRFAVIRGDDTVVFTKAKEPCVINTSDVKRLVLISEKEELTASLHIRYFP